MEIPFLTAALPGTGGRLRAEDDDFVVHEIPAYEPAGAGDHLFLLVEKRGITTHQAADRIAVALGRRARDIGYAGLKDAHAVAVQTFSVEHVPEADARVALQAVPGLRVVSARLHRNKLKLGHLRGNRFVIRVRDVVPDAAARARAVLDALAASGCPNWFGEQRFGSRGDNDAVGRHLVRREWDAACELLRTERRVADALQNGATSERAVLSSIPRPLLRLFVSAYQSALFNRLVAERLEALARLETGDLAFLHDRGAVFVVADAAAEQPRADRFEISASAPLFGTRTLLAQGAPGDRERALLASEALEPPMFKVPVVGEMDGERRPIRMRVEEPVVVDEGASIVVSFSLPRGSYATAVLREVMK